MKIQNIPVDDLVLEREAKFKADNPSLPALFVF